MPGVTTLNISRYCTLGWVRGETGWFCLSTTVLAYEWYISFSSALLLGGKRHCHTSSVGAGVRHTVYLSLKIPWFGKSQGGESASCWGRMPEAHQAKFIYFSFSFSPRRVFSSLSCQIRNRHHTTVFHRNNWVLTLKQRWWRKAKSRQVRDVQRGVK